MQAVRGVNLTLEQGERLAIVGESGSGKSTSAQAIIKLLPGTGEVTGGSIMFNGRDLVEAAPTRRCRTIRGKEIGYVPQDPMSNLNPRVDDRLPGRGGDPRERHGHRQEGRP